MVPVLREPHSRTVVPSSRPRWSNHVRHRPQMSAWSSAHLRGSADPLAASGDRDGLRSDVVTAASVDDGAVAPSDGVLVLIAALCRSLEAERVRYCHWKSNESIARSA